MTKEFLDYYSSNLSFMRNLSAEFAQEFPKIASRLDLSALECQDPFIERLLEGTAFLTARIEQKLDAGYPRFLESILQSISPLSLSPIPSGAVITPRNFDSASTPCNINIGTEFTRNVKVSSKDVKFQSLINTQITSLEVTKVEYLTKVDQLGTLDLNSKKSIFSIEIASNGKKLLNDITLDYLDLYFNLSTDDNSTICELINTYLDSLYIENNGNFLKVSDPKLELSILAEKDNLLQQITPTLQGLNTIYLCNAYPDFLRLVRLGNLRQVFNRLSGRNARLVFVLNSDTEYNFESSLDEHSILLNCVPVINLFKARSNRNFINHGYEVNVNVDASSPLDHEIFSLNSIELFDRNNQFLFNAFPFYYVRSKDSDKYNENYRNYYAINRKPRHAGLNGNKRSPYNKNEVYLTLSGEDYKEHIGDELQFSANCYCTNADLPLFISQSDLLKTTKLRGFSDFSFVSPLTRPRQPIINAGTKDDFEKMSFVLQNLSTMISGSEESCLYNIKQIIKGYSLLKDGQKSLLVEALTSVKIGRRTFRFIEQGCVYYENGFTFNFMLDSKKLKGFGVFYFSRMLACLLQSFAPANVPLELSCNLENQRRVYECKILGN